MVYIYIKINNPNDNYNSLLINDNNNYYYRS